jgi:hypothetical protein
MKALIEQILTDTSARERTQESQLSAAVTAKFAPWSTVETR